MKKFTIWQFVIALFLISNFSYSQIISQYIETNSGTTPKGIEVWNNTAGELDFAANNLEVFKGGNGGAPALDFTLSSGTLPSGDVIVIGTSDMEATATGNGAVFHFEGFSFNGDDALEIWYGGTKTDVFGMPGTDPGSQWTGNGVSTKNQNIGLKSGITSGSLTGWTDPSTRFETVCTDNCQTGFGIAPVLGGAPTADAPTFSPAAGVYTTAQDVTISTTTPGATIYYTMGDNPPDPDNTSLVYDPLVPVNIAATTTLKAIAYAAGMTESSISTANYVFPIDIADMATLRMQADDGTVYRLTGEAFLTYQQSYRHKKYIQDGTAGIEIDDNPEAITTSYSIGDGITGIIGSLNTYYGMLQFQPSFDPGAATSTGNVIVPVVITPTEFVTNFEMYEGQLVHIDNLMFADAGNFSNGNVYGASDPYSNALDFRTSFYSVDYIGTAIPSQRVNITGIANGVNNNNYLSARDAADMELVPPGVPLSSTGILLAGLLMAGVLVVRRGRLF